MLTMVISILGAILCFGTGVVILRIGIKFMEKVGKAIDNFKV